MHLQARVGCANQGRQKSFCRECTHLLQLVLHVGNWYEFEYRHGRPL
jgi:hypothetical protein